MRDGPVIRSSHCFQKSSPDCNINPNRQTWVSYTTSRQPGHSLLCLSSQCFCFDVCVWGGMCTTINRSSLLTSLTFDCCSFFWPAWPEQMERRGWCWSASVCLSWTSRTPPSCCWAVKIVWDVVTRCPSCDGGEQDTWGDWTDLSTEILQFVSIQFVSNTDNYRFMSSLGLFWPQNCINWTFPLIYGFNSEDKRWDKSVRLPWTSLVTECRPAEMKILGALGLHWGPAGDWWSWCVTGSTALAGGGTPLQAPAQSRTPCPTVRSCSSTWDFAPSLCPGVLSSSCWSRTHVLIVSASDWTCHPTESHRTSPWLFHHVRAARDPFRIDPF